MKKLFVTACLLICGMQLECSVAEKITPIAQSVSVLKEPSTWGFAFTVGSACYTAHQLLKCYEMRTSTNSFRRYLKACDRLSSAESYRGDLESNLSRFCLKGKQENLVTGLSIAVGFYDGRVQDCGWAVGRAEELLKKEHPDIDMTNQGRTERIVRKRLAEREKQIAVLKKKACFGFLATTLSAGITFGIKYFTKQST